MLAVARALAFGLPPDAALGFARARLRTARADFRRVPRRAQFAPPLGRPPGFVHLPSARHGQRVGGNVFCDDRPRGDIGPVAHAHRSDQRGVAADKDAAADGRGMFARAVVVAGNGAGTDVGFTPDARVAQIAQVHSLHALAENAVLRFDEVTHVRALQQ